MEPNGKKVVDAVEDQLESCAQVILDIEVVDSLLWPENLEVNLRYVLKHATRRGGNIFQLFDTSEKLEPLRGKQKTMVGKSQGRDGARQENGQNEWQGTSPAVPRQNLANARASAKLVVSWRRRRPLGLDGRQAKAKGCLRELGQGNVEVPWCLCKSVFPVSKWQARSENGQTKF